MMPSETARPQCLIVTGRPGAGKTTLARRLADTLRRPLISRDAIKEGFVGTRGTPHDSLPAGTNGAVTTLFFEIVSQHLAGGVSVVIEAAFQHAVWAAHIDELARLGDPFFLICLVDGPTAAGRREKRQVDDPQWTFFHGAEEVAGPGITGAGPSTAAYAPPDLPFPTQIIATEQGVQPAFDAILSIIKGDSG